MLKKVPELFLRSNAHIQYLLANLVYKYNPHIDVKIKPIKEKAVFPGFENGVIWHDF